MKKVLEDCGLFRRGLALVLAFVMVLGYLPTAATRASAAAVPGTVTTVADPETLTRPAQIYGQNTLNAGKITVGKSVSTGGITLPMGTGTQSLTPGKNNFLVTISQYAQAMGIVGQTNVPVDVVFVLDTSGSMNNGRASSMVTAANSAIKTLLEANENNRVAVVAFSSENRGGGTSGGAAANVLSSLAHYDGEGASAHLTWVNQNGSASGSNRSYIAGRDNVTVTSNGQTRTVRAYRNGYYGGTNIHGGIAAGAKILTSVTDPSYTDPATQKTVTRIPFLIVLSDGQPTYSYDDGKWYNPTLSGDNAANQQGDGNNPYEGNGYLVALTAAYYKGLITEHYYGSNASEDQRCFVYSMGVQLDTLSGDDQNLAYITLDPAAYTTGDYAADNAASYWNYGNTADNNNKSTAEGWKTYWTHHTAAGAGGYYVRVDSDGRTWVWTGTGAPQAYYELEEPVAPAVLQKPTEPTAPSEPVHPGEAPNRDDYSSNWAYYAALYEYNEKLDDYEQELNRYERLLEQYNREMAEYPEKLAAYEEALKNQAAAQQQYEKDKAAYDAWLTWREENFTYKEGTYYFVSEESIAATKKYVDGIGYTGGIAYNDDYFDVTDLAQMEAIFEELVRTIQKKAMSAPTHVDATLGSNFSGYVHFSDVIGEYMEVKDMKGIVAGGYFYQGQSFAQMLEGFGTGSAAGNQQQKKQYEFDQLIMQVLQTRMTISESTAATAEEFLKSALASKNQAYWNSASDYDNSIVWYGSEPFGSESQLQMLGFADDDSISYIEAQKAAKAIPANAKYVCRSYFFYGEAGGANPNPEHDYLYFMVRVQRSLEAPYQQTVVISAPASLLSVEKVMITEEADGGFSAEVTAAQPARVVYEVGLRGDINAQNVDQIVAQNYRGELVNGSGTVNYDPATGTYRFFTNDWNRDEAQGSHHRPMTEATFYAASDNAFYAYQQDTLLLDQDGNAAVYDSASGGTYYYSRTYYDWSKATLVNGVYTGVEEKTALIRVQIDKGTQLKQSGGKWYIPAGVFTASTLQTTGDDITKDPNTTGTSEVISHAHRTGTASDSHYTVKLGNNGLLTLVADPAKTVANVTRNITDANGKTVMVDDVLEYKIKVVNNAAAPAKAVVTDKIPTGTALVDGSISHSGVLTDGTITWNLDLEANETVTVSFRVKVLPDALSGTGDVQNITNTASIQIGNDPAYNTNTTTNPPEGKKVVAEDGSVLGDVQVGTVLTYRIRFYNDTGKTASQVTVTDRVPAGTTFVSADHNGVYDAGTNTITWTFANVGVGGSGVVSFDVKVDASAKQNASGTQPESGGIAIQNSATIQIGNNAPEITNQTSTPVKTGDVAVTKVVTNADKRGQSFTVTLTDSTGKLSGTYALSGGSKAAVTFTNGVSEAMTIRHGDTLTVKGLPEGTVLYVAEADATGWTAAYSDDDGGVDPRRIVVENGRLKTFTVTNTYHVKSVTFQLKGTKNFTGTNFPAGAFTFRAVGTDENGNPLTGDAAIQVTATVRASAGQSTQIDFSFTPREFTKEETRYYIIDEAAVSIPGVITDGRQYMLKLEIRDVNAQLTVNAQLRSRAGSTQAWGAWGEFNWQDTSVQFTNTYAPKEVNISFGGTKKLSGRYLMEHEISFQLLYNGVTISTTTNAAFGSGSSPFAFRDVTITAADMGGAVSKEFTYVIREVSSGSGNMDYDEALYQIVVTIEDQNGELKETGRVITKYTPGNSGYTSAPADAVVFNNVYHVQDTHITLSGNKVLTGTAAAGLKAEQFTFAIHESNSAFSTIGALVSGAGNAADLDAAGGFKGAIAFADIGYKASMLDDVTPVGNIKTKLFYYIAKEVIPGTNQPTFDANMKYDDTQYRITAEVRLNVATGELTAQILTVQKDSGTPVTVNAGSYSGLDFTNRQNPDTVTYYPTGMKTTAGQAGTVVPDTLRFSFRVVGLGTDISRLTLGRVEATGISQGIAASTGDTIDFTALPYTAADVGKTYYYLIEEATTETGNMVGYDDTLYVLAVTVSRNDDGEMITNGVYHKLEAQAKIENGVVVTDPNQWTELSSTEKMAFTNTYSAYATLDITADKKLTGNRELKPNEFDFRLQLLDRQGRPTASVVDGINGAAENNTSPIRFGTLIFTGAQMTDTFKHSTSTEGGSTVTVYRYNALMSEIRPESAAIPGITYDPRLYLVTIEWKVTVPAGGQASYGTPRITGVYEAQRSADSYVVKDGAENLYQGSIQNNVAHTGVTFTNSYAPTSATVTISAKKTLSGRALKEHEFAFELYRDGALVETGTNDANGLVTFTRTFPSNISDSYFTETDADGDGLATFVYTLKEVQTNKGGIDYSDAQYTVEVVLKHDADTAALSVVSVTYKDKDGKVVTDGSDADTTVDEDEIVFANTYSTDEAFFTPEAGKTVLGANDAPMAELLKKHTFTFQVYLLDGAGNTVYNGEVPRVVSTGTSGADGKVTFSPIFYSFGDDGVHIYKIREMSYTDPTITADPVEYFLRVEVRDDGSGDLSVSSARYYDTFAAAAGDNGNTAGKTQGPDFINHYGPGYVNVDLELNKEMTVSGALDFELKDSQFDFTVRDSSGREVTSGTNNAAGKILFGSITITRDQLGGARTGVFTYTISEDKTFGRGVTADPKIITAAVTVTDDGYGNLTYSVAYTDNDGREGNDNTFTNKYEAASVKQTIVAHKYLTGKAMAAGEFTFQLLDQTGTTVITTAVNDAQGNVVFEREYIQEGTYTYILKEAAKANNSLSGTYTFDDDYYRITVVVSDDTQGKLFVSAYTREKIVVTNGAEAAPEAAASMEFYNSFKAASLVLDLTTPIGGTKDVVDIEGSSREDLLKENAFAFEVRDIQNKLVSTGLSRWDDEAGLARVELEEFTFTTDGEYHYWIYEKDTKAPYVKDESIYEIHILVHRNTSAQPLELKDEKGSLIRVVEPGALYIIPEEVMTFAYAPAALSAEGISSQAAYEDPVKFTNVFAPGSVSITLTADKTLVGRELKEGEFTFHLTETIGGVTYVRGEATNAADGSITFRLDYAVEGEHTYSIHEHIPAEDLRAGGVSYDTAAHKDVVTVKVTEENGSLTAQVKGESGITFKTGVTFTNTYSASPVTAQVEASKLLSGSTLEADAFTFELVDRSGEVAATAQNGADGKILFRLPMTKAGVYRYTIREKAGNDKHITYDDAKYAVTVQVTDNGRGALEYAVTYQTDDGTAPVFVNVYNEPFNPDTGDNSQVKLVTVALLLSASALVVLLMMKRSKGGKYAK